MYASVCLCWPWNPNLQGERAEQKPKFQTAFELWITNLLLQGIWPSQTVLPGFHRFETADILSDRTCRPQKHIETIYQVGPSVLTRWIEELCPNRSATHVTLKTELKIARIKYIYTLLHAWRPVDSVGEAGRGCWLLLGQTLFPHGLKDFRKLTWWFMWIAEWQSVDEKKKE